MIINCPNCDKKFEIDKKWKHPKNNKKITQLLNNLPTTSLRSIKIL